MKFKTLKRVSPVDKKYDEFASIGEDGGIYTHEHPHPLGNEATIEVLKSIAIGCKDVNWDEYEIVEIEYFEADTVGADIRNKLSPPLNLISLLKLYFDEDKHKAETLDEIPKKMATRQKLEEFIKKEMVKAEENIKYIANLL